MRNNRQRLKLGIAVAAVLGALALMPGAASANCGGGGVSAAETDVCTPTAKARLLPSGMLIPPKSAPLQVKQVIAAANRIRTKPYVWGGGHGKWKSRGYDCSGAVSYVLHAAGLLRKPMVSGALGTRWGAPGIGQWITVFGSPSHAYMIVAGLRFDTSQAGDPLSQGSGPRWRTTLRTAGGYSTRFSPGL